SVLLAEALTSLSSKMMRRWTRTAPNRLPRLCCCSIDAASCSTVMGVRLRSMEPRLETADLAALWIRSRCPEGRSYRLHALAVHPEVRIPEPRSRAEVDDLAVAVELDVIHEAQDGRCELRV